MSEKERRYLCWLEEVVHEKATLSEAAGGMGVSYRQARRLLKKYRESGDAGLVHGLRGKPSTHKVPESTKAAVLARYREEYSDFGPTLASENLAKRDNLTVNAETLRLWLVEAGLRKVRVPKTNHRSWRQRKAHFGEMVQGDGSIHDWFEGRGPKCFLMSLVDDATGITLLQFAEQETTWAAIDITRAWVERYGVPQSLYLDRKNVYITDREETREEQLAGKPALTQFGSACHKLGVRIIAAHSPQAKGRVERKHGVCQDRLIKEMRLAGISSIAEANAFLAAGWLDEFNAKFGKDARNDQDGHRPLPKQLDLDCVFCLEETRVVGNDWTIRFDNTRYQILKQTGMPSPGQRVTVQTRRDESIVIRGKEGPLKSVVVETALQTPERSEQLDMNRPDSFEKAPRIPHKPAEDHPWRSAYQNAIHPTNQPGAYPQRPARPAEIEEMAQQYLPKPSFNVGL